MIAADRAAQRPADAKLLVLDRRGASRTRRALAWSTTCGRATWWSPTTPRRFPRACTACTCDRRRDRSATCRTRVAGARGRRRGSSRSCSAPATSDQRTEDRPAAAAARRPATASTLGPLTATIEAMLDHPRLVTLRFDGAAATVWAGLARHGRPIQYAHVPEPLALWDVWTPIAGVPVAFEAPSASFALDWEMVRELRGRGIEFATITLAAGISSTGDPELDRRLPLDEPYRVPAATARAIDRARARRPHRRGRHHGGAGARARARDGAVRAGDGIADQRIGPDTPTRRGRRHPLRHPRAGTSHYDVLRAFASEPRAGSRQRRARDPRLPDPRVRRLGPDRAATDRFPRPTRRPREIGGRTNEAESPQPDRQRRRQGARLPAEALRTARHGQKQRHHGRPLRRRRLRAGLDEGGPLGGGHLPAELPHRLHAAERREGERDQPAPEGRRARRAAAGPCPRGLGVLLQRPGGFMVEVACW